MTADEIKTLLQNIVAAANQGADLVGVIDPGLLPFIAIGKAIDKQIPGLVAPIASWIAGNPPTQEELDDFAQKLAVLSNPDLP